MEGLISKSGMKDLERPDRGSLEVRCMQFMDSVDLSPQANSMCLRNMDPIGLGPRDPVSYTHLTLPTIYSV